MDTTDYWNSQDKYRFVYLDGSSKEIINSMIEYCIWIFCNYNNSSSSSYQRYRKEKKVDYENKDSIKKKVQIFCPDTDFNFSVLSDQKKGYFTKLILYDKEI